MGSQAVEVQGVSKRFRLYHEKYTSLKERVIHAGRIPYQDLWALRDVGFDVREGETLGILGRNGSGKSTLLKCICGVLQPTSGQVVVRGKLAGLLELGAGFQQELSGRENIYLNGSMLGLSKREVDRMFDDIVEFAELGQFIDNQVKFYSSGMYVRLGFAVAVNVDPDVLVIDEVLAVGDERFQRKCMERVKQFQREGRTILFVSHAPDLVRNLCDRAVVLADGEMVGMGAPGEAVRLFRERLLEAGDVLGAREAEGALDAASEEAPALAEGSDPIAPAGVGLAPAPMAAVASSAASATSDPAGAAIVPGTEPGLVQGAEARTHNGPGDSRPVRLVEVSSVLPTTSTRRYLLPGEPLTIRVAFESTRAVEGVVFQLDIRNDEGLGLFSTDTEALGVRCDVQPGPGTFEFRLESVPLLDGAYDVNLGVQTSSGLSDWREPACRFEVMNPGRSTGAVAIPVKAALVGGGALSVARDGLAVPADGTVVR
ncbi:MAG: ABC transporter ATP-binding protein [Acidimicrobiales bacterium]